VIYDKKILSVKLYPYIDRNIKKFKIVTSNINYDYKSTDRSSIDQLVSKKYDDILIVDYFNNIKDISIANIAMNINGTWFTPAKPLLKGTKRAQLLDDSLIFEKELRLNDLVYANTFAIMNAMVGFKIIDNPIFYIEKI
jgi:4-amino-4-deoxychorismate lyase